MNSTSTTSWSSSTGYSVAAVTLSLLFVALFACLMLCKIRDRSPRRMIILQQNIHRLNDKEEESKEEGEDRQMIHTLDSENFETIELETSNLEKKQKPLDPELVSDIESVTMPKQLS